MKRYVAIALLVLSCQAGMAQTMDKLFNDFRHKKDVERVSIGSFLMSFVNMFGNDTHGVNSVEVLAFSDCSQSVKEDLNRAIKNLKDPKFETMVNVKENGEEVKIMVNIDKETIKELVIIANEKDEAALVRIKGKIRPEELEEVVNEHKK